MKWGKWGLMYAPDLTKPPGECPPEMVTFPSLFGLLKYLVKTPAARAAIRAGRFRSFRVAKDRK